MRNKLIKRIYNNRRSIVMFLMGITLGITLFLILYGHKLDALYQERTTYYYENNQKYKEISQLQQEIDRLTRGYRHQEDKIKKIQVEVSGENSFATESIQTEVEKTLEPFMDKSINWVSSNPDLVQTILERHQIEIDTEKQIKVQVKYLSLFHSTLKIWVIVKEVPPELVKPGA